MNGGGSGLGSRLGLGLGLGLGRGRGRGRGFGFGLGLGLVLGVVLGLGGLARAEGLSKKPELKTFVEAAAPEALARRGRVRVVLNIDLDEKGHVTSVAVAEPGPAGEGFDEAARAAAEKFEFTPGESDGKPVPVRITYEYVFVEKTAPPPPVPKPADVRVPLAGRVLSKGERVPLAGVRVLVDDGATAQTTTDTDGRFTLTLAPGRHVIHLRGAGVTPTGNPVDVQPDRRLEVTYYAPSKTRYSAIVRGQRAVEETVEHTISQEELKHIPGTQGDTLKAVQNLPGLARSPFGAGLLIVWGSSPLDTRVYADGVFIPTLYHFGGLRSTVNSEVVENLTFTPGGYGVEHGRGMGGVIEIETRRPRTDGYHGFAQVDVIDASAFVEGRVAKNVELALGVRRSTIDAWLPLATPNDFQLTPTYWDYQAKLHARLSARDDLDAFVFGSDDLIHLVTNNADPNLTFQFDSHIYYHRALVRWTHRFAGRATLSITQALGYDVPFQFRGTSGSLPLSVDAETFEYTTRAVLRWPVTPFLRLDGGIDFEGNRATFTAQTPTSFAPVEGDPNFGGGGRTSGFTSQSALIYLHQLAPFVAASFALLDKKLTIVAGLRFDLYSWIGYQGTPNQYNYEYALWEPRLQLRYQIVKWAAVKAAFGIYHEPPSPQSLLRVVGNPATVPQVATHYVLGADFDPTPTLHISAELFYKDLSALVVRGESFFDPALVSFGIGRVYGGELLVRQELWRNFFGWIAYTVSRSERKDHPDRPWRPFQFDQTHILTLIASYKLPRGYQVGVRFRYVTGNPYTPVVPPNGYFDGNTGGYRALYGDIYSSRVDAFHQLDIRFDKTWTFNRWRLVSYIDLQNLYNNRAPEGYTYNFNYTQKAAIAGLPIIPDLGLRGEF